MQFLHDLLIFPLYQLLKTLYQGGSFGEALAAAADRVSPVLALVILLLGYLGLALGWVSAAWREKHTSGAAQNG